VQAQEDERARIAADVHDDSVQVLAALEIRLGMLRNQTEQAAPQLLASTDASLETARAATGRLRELLFDLEAPARGTDLASALESAAAHVFEDLDVACRVEGDRGADLPESLRITAYRIAKEALVNVRKHARAHHVVVDVARDDDGLLLTIDDDGLGIDADAVVARPGHLGLTSMRDRATIAGGWFEVGPRALGGTRVRVRLPFRPQDAGARPGEPGSAVPT